MPMPVPSPLRRLGAAAALAALAASALPAQTVVNFDVPPADVAAMRATIQSGGVFGGLRWDAASLWGVGAWTAPVFNNQLRCHSLPMCASPNGLAPDGSTFGRFDLPTPALFDGLWVSGPAWADAIPIGSVGSEPNRVALELWRGGALVFTTPYLDVTPAPQRLAPSYRGLVDEVRIVGTAGATVVDDISITATPEPATVSLAAGGVLALAGVARRRRA